MGRTRNNVVWNYFEKTGDPNEKKAICRICNEEYSYISTSGNLKIHLKKQHFDSYIECIKAQNSKEVKDVVEDAKEEVIYEYVVANNPAMSDEESATATDDYSETPTTFKSRNSRASVPKKRRRVSQHAVDKQKGKRLIEELTEEKINVAHLQKELILKEMEEKNLKIALLQKEMEFKNEMYELQTEEILQRREELQHKKQYNELAKKEMLLKIEVLQATLISINRNGSPKEE